MRRDRCLLPLLLAVSSACGSGVSPVNPPPPPAVASVTLNQSALSLTPPQTATLVATVKDAAGNPLTGRTINWSTSAGAVATIDATGVVTAVSPGTAQVTATSEGQSAAATITVGPGAFLGPSGGSTSAFNGNVSLTFPAGALSTGTAVTIALVASPPPDPMLVTGTAYDFGPTGTNFAQPVTLKLKYTAGSLPASGVEGSLRLHLRNGAVWEPVAGSTVDVPTKTVTGSITHFSVYAILDIPMVQSVLVAPTADNISTGATRQFTATVTADVGAAQTVTWRTSTPTVATISASGLATAIGVGTTTITALSTVDTNRRATAQLTVSAPAFPINWTETNDGIIGPPEIPALTSIAVRGDGSVIGVSPGGVISQRSLAGTWTAAQSPVTTDLYTVSAPSTDSVWLSGAAGKILRRTAAGTWATETSGRTGDLVVSMNADGTGYAIESGASSLIRRQGGLWGTVAVAPRSFSNISTFGSTVFASTGASSILRFDGAAWTTLNAPNVNVLESGSAVIALNGTDALVGGSTSNFQATILRVNGATWATEWVSTLQTTANFAGPFVKCTDGSIMAVTTTGLVLARTGTTWVVKAEGQTIPNYGPAYQIACTNSNDWYYIGSGRNVAHVNLGVTTTELYRSALGTVSVGSSGFAFAAQKNGRVTLKWNGATWTPLPIPNAFIPSSGGPGLAAWSATGAMVLAGDNGQGNWNGTGWTWSTHTGPAYGMWASGPNDVWAVGTASDDILNGHAGILHYTGTWNDASSRTLNATFLNVHGVGTAVFAVGATPASTGVIGRPNAGATDAVATNLSDVVVFSATSAIAVGRTGGAFRWNGTTWTAIPLGNSENLVAVTGRSVNEVYAFGDQGSLYGWNGTQWTLIKHLAKTVRAARMVGDFGIAVGDDGQIVYGRLNPGLRR